MVSLGPKKDGGPNIEFFQSPETMQGFEIIRQWLQKNCKKVSWAGGHTNRMQCIQKIYTMQNTLIHSHIEMRLIFVSNFIMNKYKFALKVTATITFHIYLHQLVNGKK